MDAFGTLLCETLGLDAKRVRALTVRAEPDKTTFVLDTEMTDEQTKSVLRFVERYELAPKETT